MAGVRKRTARNRVEEPGLWNFPWMEPWPFLEVLGILTGCDTESVLNPSHEHILLILRIQLIPDLMPINCPSSLWLFMQSFLVSGVSLTISYRRPFIQVPHLLRRRFIQISLDYRNIRVVFWVIDTFLLCLILRLFYRPWQFAHSLDNFLQPRWGLLFPGFQVLLVVRGLHRLLRWDFRLLSIKSYEHV